MSRARTWRILGLIALLAAIGVGLYVLPRQQFVAGFLEWARGLGVWGVVLIALAYIPACVLFVPGSVLTLAAGYLYGLVPATIAISLGSTAGASAAFWVGRTLARDWVAQRVKLWPKFAALDQAVAESGFQIVLLTRLSPVFPFNLLNYAFGVTRVRFRDYLLASWLGMLPATILYVYLGTTAAALSDVWSGKRTMTVIEQVALAAGAVMAIVAVFVITRAARRVLARQLPETSEGRRS